jgi:hypothetical protein
MEALLVLSMPTIGHRSLETPRAAPRFSRV